MACSQRYQINAPQVIGEVIDGEAIIVNLDSGAYYSVRDTGAELWQALEQGASPEQIITHWVASYDAAPSAIAASVQALLEEFVQEQLIVPVDRVNVTSVMELTGAARSERLPFSKPTLEKYTDMADLLLLDPIHEVDEQGGWPRPGAGQR